MVPRDAEAILPHTPPPAAPRRIDPAMLAAWRHGRRRNMMDLN